MFESILRASETKQNLSLPPPPPPPVPNAASVTNLKNSKGKPIKPLYSQFVKASSTSGSQTASSSKPTPAYVNDNLPNLNTNPWDKFKKH